MHPPIREVLAELPPGPISPTQQLWQATKGGKYHADPYCPSLPASAPEVEVDLYATPEGAYCGRCAPGGAPRARTEAAKYYHHVRGVYQHLGEARTAAQACTEALTTGTVPDGYAARLAEAYRVLKHTTTRIPQTAEYTPVRRAVTDQLDQLRTVGAAVGSSGWLAEQRTRWALEVMPAGYANGFPAPVTTHPHLGGEPYSTYDGKSPWLYKGRSLAVLTNLWDRWVEEVTAGTAPDRAATALLEAEPLRDIEPDSVKQLPREYTVPAGQARSDNPWQELLGAWRQAAGRELAEVLHLWVATYRELMARACRGRSVLLITGTSDENQARLLAQLHVLHGMIVTGPGASGLVIVDDLHAQWLKDCARTGAYGYLGVYVLGPAQPSDGEKVLRLSAELAPSTSADSYAGGYQQALTAARAILT
jgi:hypothetical protein